MHEWEELDNVKFGDLVERFPDAVILKPAATHVMAKGDKPIVIAEDDDTCEFCHPLEAAAHSDVQLMYDLRGSSFRGFEFDVC
jgi:hypothetical protein